MKKMFIVFIVLFSVLLLSACATSVEDEVTSKAKEFVKYDLISPSTVVFCGDNQTTAELSHEMNEYYGKEYDVWTIEGCLDSQNEYGATIRSNWSVELTNGVGGFDDWRPIRITIF